MPIYEYRCAGCGARREEILSYEDSQVTTFACDTCPGRIFERVFSSPNFKVAPNSADIANHVLAGGSLRDHVPSNDTSDTWEGYPDSFREKMERPNPLYYKSDKPTVDMGS